LCITIGKEVKVLNGENTYIGIANGITSDGSLLISLADGTQKIISSGEASVRGLFGYL
jgi:BirA family biotin operon repressor/biotin-[acetyl-CoA-carboxylase] ligase